MTLSRVEGSPTFRDLPGAGGVVSGHEVELVALPGRLGPMIAPGTTSNKTSVAGVSPPKRRDIPSPTSVRSMKLLFLARPSPAYVC
ncbi:MAG: hypothetical protein EOP24_27005 [Hyphomicrobiales bacterium]|nr:MAG: hypothetical protein EOP24_27005 [Hyphomicrobiales bacterium]